MIKTFVILMVLILGRAPFAAAQLLDSDAMEITSNAIESAFLKSPELASCRQEIAQNYAVTCSGKIHTSTTILYVLNTVTYKQECRSSEPGMPSGKIKVRVRVRIGNRGSYHFKSDVCKFEAN